MPICPACGQESSRRRAGKCPKCDAFVEIYRPRGADESIWVFESVKTLDIVKALEAFISQSIGYRFSFENVLPELAMAKTLYEKCGYSQSLAMEVLFVYFDPEIPRRKIWTKNPKSLATVLWDDVNDRGQRGCFSIALSIAKERIREKEQIFEQKQIDL